MAIAALTAAVFLCPAAPASAASQVSLVSQTPTFFGSDEIRDVSVVVRNDSTLGGPLVGANTRLVNTGIPGCGFLVPKSVDPSEPVALPGQTLSFRFQVKVPHSRSNLDGCIVPFQVQDRTGAAIPGGSFGFSWSVRPAPRRGPPPGTRGAKPKPFGGASMASRNLTTEIIHSLIFVRVRCATQTFAGYVRPNDFGFCTGTISLLSGHREVARAPFGIRTGDSWSVDIPASRSLQVSAKRAHRLHLNVVVRSHDGQGHTKTTTGKLTLLPSK